MHTPEGPLKYQNLLWLPVPIKTMKAIIQSYFLEEMITAINDTK